MRKTICLLCAVILCLSLACPVFATSNTFVPSITYKEAPTVEEATMEEENTTHCLVLIPIATAQKNIVTATANTIEKELVEVYEKLESGEMTIPVEEDHVIRELVSVTLDHIGCIDPSHGHQEWLAEEGNCLTVSFDLGVAPDEEVSVMLLVGEEWIPAENIVNNGDGTITCDLEDLGTVAFTVKAAEPVSQTEGPGSLLWVIILVICLVFFVILLLRRKKKEEE